MEVLRPLVGIDKLLIICTFTAQQGGDSAAGTQALPVGKIIDDKVCRKDNQKVSRICIC